MMVVVMVVYGKETKEKEREKGKAVIKNGRRGKKKQGPVERQGSLLFPVERGGNSFFIV